VPSGYDWFRQAQQLWAEGLQTDAAARDCLKRAIESGELTADDAGQANFMLGLSLKTIDAPDAAFEPFACVPELLPPEDPRTIAAHDALGGFLFAEGRFEEAADHYAAALAADRDDSSAPEWMFLLAICIFDSEVEPSQATIDEAYALADEAYALLTGPDGDRFVGDFPYEQTVLQCMTVRATVRGKQGDWRAYWEADELFAEAERYGLSHLGPNLGSAALRPVYRRWIQLRAHGERHEAAQALLEHAERQLSDSL
jgi:tetratricopeptide (TPR) repeat protein